MRLQGEFRKLAGADFSPLMRVWEERIREDNRAGVLAGLDCHGHPMVPVKYRPRPARAQLGAQTHLKRFVGVGPVQAGRNNNLTSAQYRTYAGPPLAPRGPYSRVITNLHTEHGRVGPVWFAAGAWVDVVSVQGVPFLPAHFNGARTGRGGRVKLPARDLRGLRPDGYRHCQQDAFDFIRGLIQGLI